MSKVRFKRYMHSNKEDNYDLEETFKDNELLYCGYEEELVYEYDTLTKELKLIGAGGYFLGDEKISESELTEIKEYD